MTAPVPSRAAIDAAEPLDFPARRPTRQELTIAITAVVNGFTTEITFSGQIEQLDALTKRLRELGAEPQETNRNNVTVCSDKPRKPATRTQPAYDGNGDAICPVHKRELKEGKWGLYCSAKDKETGEYCKLKFE